MIKGAFCYHTSYCRTNHRKFSLQKNGSLITRISPIKDDLLLQQMLRLIKNLDLTCVSIQLHVQTADRLYCSIFCYPIYRG